MSCRRPHNYEQPAEPPNSARGPSTEWPITAWSWEWVSEVLSTAAGRASEKSTITSTLKKALHIFAFAAAMNMLRRGNGALKHLSALGKTIGERKQLSG